MCDATGDHPGPAILGICNHITFVSRFSTVLFIPGSGIENVRGRLDIPPHLLRHRST